jgi:hypothetical protein
MIDEFDDSDLFDGYARPKIGQPVTATVKPLPQWQLNRRSLRQGGKNLHSDYRWPTDFAIRLGRRLHSVHDVSLEEIDRYFGWAHGTAKCVLATTPAPRVRPPCPRVNRTFPEPTPCKDD